MFELLRRFHIPDDLLPGSLSLSHLHNGKATCHCAEGEGHPVWFLTFMVKGKKQVQHIPKDGMKDVKHRVEAGREFQDAVQEALAAKVPKHPVPAIFYSLLLCVTAIIGCKRAGGILRDVPFCRQGEYLGQ
ncbi:MAG TPA: DUF6788 family protein [Terriglobia bacterium]|nr:DUF6788 family protein [Terriglobia bacterium]